MKNKLLNRCASLLTTLFLLVPAALAQVPTDNVSMADDLRQSGKIYVVVAAVFIIVLGLLLYLFLLDRKVSRLEKATKP